MIEEAAEAVRAGKLIIFPTDTVYGIGCDPFNGDALTILYEVKKRSTEKSIPVLVDSIETAIELAVISDSCRKLLEKHWPGALTVVVEMKAQFPNEISANQTIALRMPNHEDLLELITQVGGALAASSANISGKPALLTYDEVYAMFTDKVDVILPGKVQEGISSTVIDCTGEKPLVLREGPVSIV